MNFIMKTYKQLWQIIMTGFCGSCYMHYDYLYKWISVYKLFDYIESFLLKNYSREKLRSYFQI